MAFDMDHARWIGVCQKFQKKKNPKRQYVWLMAVSKALVPTFLYGYLCHVRVEDFWASISNIGLFVNKKMYYSTMHIVAQLLNS